MKKFHENFFDEILIFYEYRVQKNDYFSKICIFSRSRLQRVNVDSHFTNFVNNLNGVKNRIEKVYPRGGLEPSHH
jgi:hypothetical protein